MNKKILYAKFDSYVLKYNIKKEYICLKDTKKDEEIIRHECILEKDLTNQNVPGFLYKLCFSTSPKNDIEAALNQYTILFRKYVNGQIEKSSTSFKYLPAKTDEEARLLAEIL